MLGLEAYCSTTRLTARHGGSWLDMNGRGLRALYDILAVAQAERWSSGASEQHPSCQGGVVACQALLSMALKLV